jgi:long-chain fatty acid transport protein
MKHWINSGILAILGLTLCATSAEALLVDPKAAGMALVGVAYPQDAYAGAFNPAGTTQVCDRFDIGLSVVNTRGTATVRGNAVPGQNGSFDPFKLENFYNPDFGINKQICGTDFSVALVGYNVAHAYTKYEHVFGIIGTRPLRFDLTTECLAPVIGWQINECHSIGIAIDFMVQSFKVSGIDLLAAASSSPGNLTSQGRDFSWGVGFTLGWQGQILPCLTLGVTYQPKVHMSKFHDYRGLLAQHGRMDVPATTTAGFAWEFYPCAHLVVDYQFIQHSRIRSRGNKFFNPNSPNNLLGENGGPGFGWLDQHIVRVGVDYDINDCWTVRAGYRYGNPPVRKSQTGANLLTCETEKQFVTLGASYRFSCNEISVYYAHGFRNKIIGAPNSISQQQGGGSVDLEKALNIVGISFGQFF